MTKKATKIIKWLDTGIFPASIMLSVGFNYDEISYHLTKMKAWPWKTALSLDKPLIDGGNNFALRRIIENKKTKEIERRLFYLILKTPFNFSDYDYCKLAHECVHLCQFILPDMLDREREYECEAYLHTHIMKQCLDAIRGNKK